MLRISKALVLVLVLVAARPAEAQTTALPPYASPNTEASAESERNAANSSTAVARPQRASATALPDWQDGQSVYLSMNEQAVGHREENGTQPQVQPIADAPSLNTTSPPVSQASFSAPASQLETPAVSARGTPPLAAPVQDVRRLAPPNVREGIPSASTSHATSASKLISNIGLPSNTIYSTLSALVIVIGMFLVCMWALRRGSRKSTKLLPSEVVSVLGRVPLAGRQFAELLRVGNKLVLVALMPTGAETLTEVTDPLEVDRLAGLCRQHDPHSSSLAFEDVFKQLSQEPAADGFLGHEGGLNEMTSAAAAYRIQRGGVRG